MEKTEQSLRDLASPLDLFSNLVLIEGLPLIFFFFLTIDLDSTEHFSVVFGVAGVFSSSVEPEKLLLFYFLNLFRERPGQNIFFRKCYPFVL